VINVFQPTMGPRELAAVQEVLESNWLGAGRRLDAFLRGFARHLDVPVEQLRSVTTCTEGLFQCMDALGLGPGDEVVLPSVSFVGAANAVAACGATPVLCDVDRHTLNPHEDHVAAALAPRTRAILVLHYGGHPGRIEAIAGLARERGVALVEDAACAVGSRAGGQMCGTLGDLGVWSFDAMKVLVTGDGGVVRARDPDVAERIRQATFLGIDAPGMAKSGDGTPWWELDPVLPGRNARMNDLTSALGLMQLERLPQLLARRAEVAVRYTDALRELEWLRLPPGPAPGTETSWYLYWIQTEPAVRDALARHLLARDIYTTFRYWPLHRTHLYADARPFPGADHAAAATLLLPIHAGLSDADVERVIEAIHAFRPATASVLRQ
jgi:dTDP-4-amino-4,6-dideoxygalactose transaminase